MRRREEKQLEWYYPRQENLLKQYGIPTPGDQWPKWQDEPRKRFKKAAAARQGSVVMDGPEWDNDFTLRLLKRISLYKSDMKPSIPRVLLDIVKLALFAIIMLFILVFEVIPTIILAFIMMIPGLLKYIVTRPVDFLKFMVSLVIVAFVYLIGFVLELHSLYAAIIVLALVIAGAWFVYDSVFTQNAAANQQEQAVTTDLKNVNGEAAQITNNRSAVNVTYGQLLQFLAQDDTDKTLGKYQTIRVEAAVKLHDNAEKAGIRAGVAEVNLAGVNVIAYCWNVFETTDQGLVYASYYHPSAAYNCDSLIYISSTDTDRGQVYFIPVDRAGAAGYDSLNESLGLKIITGTVSSINIVW